MELVVINYMLCVLLVSVVLTPCSSSQIDQKLQSSHIQANQQVVQLSQPTLPRRLRFTQVGREGTLSHESSSSNIKQKENVLGNKPHKKEGQEMEIKKGTRQEWIQGNKVDPSEFFTMDYSHVRRPRPIHNKSLPIGRVGP